MNGEKKVEKTTGNKKKTSKKPAQVEELKLGDSVEPEKKAGADVKGVGNVNVSLVKNGGELISDSALDPDWNPVVEAAKTPANVTLILRSADDVDRAKKVYEDHRPKKHSGNLSGVRVNEKQEPRILWRKS